jgi:hypothetical protein
MADFFFAEGELDYTTETLLGKKFAGAPAEAAGALRAVIERVEPLAAWEHEAIEGAIRPLADELSVKAGDLFGLIRVAVSGKAVSPPLFETMAVLGRERTLERLAAAVRRLQAVAGPDQSAQRAFLRIMSARYIMRSFPAKPLESRRVWTKDTHDFKSRHS